MSIQEQTTNTIERKKEKKLSKTLLHEWKKMELERKMKYITD